MSKTFTNRIGGVIGSNVVYEPVAESTNTEATLALARKEPEGATYIVDFQTKGRGQRGNFWESEEGKNLTFSILTYPGFVEVYDHFYLSKVVANGVVQALEQLGVRAKIKWPNDIYVGDLKVAGILIENGLMGNCLSHSIWGIGLNVNQQAFASDAPNPTSMALILGRELGRNEVLQAVLGAIDGWYAKLRNGEKADIDAYYFNALYRSQGVYWFMADGERFRASIKEIQHTGELVLEDERGALRSFAFKEVAFII
ncbi:biotin--[acetyl-CoA-carboxylase] ligase [uncultured Acetobacteroides sp.]|uniref:biotin--[acetyl-CoA-carboxylase] ligase n=1 Tax=uncultured Acetobacteroides sp. TaxID=1760811 RepID=UPI0029F54913|nr:biotin--[acetyl-CoA-carboxylase] ligase [uncultured Acetobacteroides sp.]